MIKEILYFVIVILGIPAGLFISKLCKDEIKSWRVRLIGMGIISLVLGIVVFFTGFEYKISVMISLFFVVIFCLTIVLKNQR